MEKELPIENVKRMVRTHIIREKPRAFTDMIFEVRMDGSASVEQVNALAKEASSQLKFGGSSRASWYEQKQKTRLCNDQMH
jgi:hypothetical protein